tara:strand:+ start:907 stop:2205 length:1299 start_codon:yes stop_codon:yes gene_type:complete
MRIHILGICGTFMAGLAHILKESGHNVSGSDSQFYPPMSEFIERTGISTITGYSAESLPDADIYVIGNALSRGNESVEYILNNKLPFISGPEILGKELKQRNVYAVSGTHGKTTTSYMLAHILLNQGHDIGYLIGGLSENFPTSSKLGTHKSFVIEADEYDSAFFDKRSKFLHYSPSNLIINNIEFDHADIFDDISDIKKQFHHAIKIIPESGNVIYYRDDIHSKLVIDQGLWCNKIEINSDEIYLDVTKRELIVKNEKFSLSDLPLIGDHNFKNYVSAILAATIENIPIAESIKSLQSFNGVRRRMDLVYNSPSLKIFDDFAHHPTAIELSVEAFKEKYPTKKILGIIELASNTMSSGFHKEDLIKSLSLLDEYVLLDHYEVYERTSSYQDLKALLNYVKDNINQYDIILIMTNKDSQKLISPLTSYLEEI